MKAVQAAQFGSPEVLRYITVPDPVVQPGQVLIKIEAASVNYADIMRRSNTSYPFPTPLPYIPGSEVAGVIKAHGDGVNAPPIGTPVFAVLPGGASGYAEYALADASQVIPIPPGLSAEQACAIVVAGLAALLILRHTARLSPGEAILIPGAGGGFGQYAIQLAKAFGAGMVVGAASSTAKRDAAQAAGADHVVDYTQPDWAEQVRMLTDGRGVDIMLESTGGVVFAQSLRALAPFGRLVVYGMASREPLVLDAEAIRHTFYDPSPNQSLHVFNLGLYFGMRPEVCVAAMHDLIGMVASGQIRVPVSHVLPLKQAAEAHRLIETRQTVGKVILKP